MSVLSWLVNAPPLLNAAPPLTLAEHVLHSASNISKSATSGPDKDQRLGRRFERLVHERLSLQPNIELCAQNVTLHNGQRTVGELDLITYDRQRDRYQHWELTLKFYLGLHQHYWPGPNSTDNLARKYTRLSDHQFPLAHSELARSSLRSLGIPRIDEQILFSRGCLFYPSDKHISPPPQAHPQHQRGQWWLTSALPKNRLWQPLSRNHWIGTGEMSDKGISMLASHQLVDYVQRSPGPLMVLSHEPGSTSVIPGFVVTDQWLESARDSEPNT